jgi:WD40-like Beta Propeller Repeat
MKKLCLVLSLALLAPFASAQAPVVSPYYDYFGKNKIVYDVFDWQIYHSTHFAIYFYDRDAVSLQKVASYAESAYDEISRALNFQIPKPINIIYYSTHSEFEQTNTLQEFIPEGVGAFALPTRNRMVLPVDLPDEKLEKLIAHELTHVFQFEILFGGNFLRAYSSNTPQWLTEGMASYFGNDEDSKDEMVLRDAVLNDQIPEIAERQIYGFFAYRFGHAVFEFMKTEWGPDGVRDFVFDYRGQLGPNLNRVLLRTFGVSSEEFDIRFRRYLRRRFLKILTDTGEPIDFGDRVRLTEEGGSVEVSVRAFPSGDLGAAISTLGEDANVVIVSARDRKLFKNLTKGYKTDYEYIVAQWLTTGPIGGVDLAVSPNGNSIAVFVRRERGRELMLLNALDGSIQQMIPMPGLDQQLNPAFSPDGHTVAFRAIQNGHSDIFAYNLDTKATSNLTGDDAYDFAPAYSPDGQWLYYSSVQGTKAKLFRVRPGVAGSREQITYGDWNDEDASISPDGKTLYYASDRVNGIYNIYAINLDNGETSLYTNVVGGCFSPIVLTARDGAERLVFSAYYKRRFMLYVTDAKKPYHKLAELNPAPSPAGPTTIPPYQPPIEVSIDPEKVDKRPSRKLTLEDAAINVGLSADQVFLSNTYLSFGDNLGDRRLIFSLQSVSSYIDYEGAYIDMSRRLQKGVQAYYQSYYYLAQTPSGEIVRGRNPFHFIGGNAFASYPLNRYYRLEGSAGFVSRKYDAYPYWNTETNFYGIPITTENNFPLFGTKLVGDTTQYESFGPISGRRLAIGLSYAPFTGGTKLPGSSGSTLSFDITADFRHYFKITRRSLFAVRLYGFRATGNLPDVLAFGGLDTLRVMPYYSIIGNSASFMNVEFRFPLIDFLATPILGIQEIRAKAFIDIGGAALKGQPWQFWSDYTLCGAGNGAPGCNGSAGGLSDYGFGLSLNFLGLPLHFDFARQWNFKEPLPPAQCAALGLETNCGNFKFIFYIGPEF